MKIIVLGKGGCGKSTVSSIMAKSLADQGLHVLVVDADESNFGLNLQLGVKEPQQLMDYLGGKKDLGKRLRESMLQGKPEAMSEMMSGKWGLSDIPEPCLSRNGNIALLQIGKVQHFGEGCACPMGALARSFLENLVVKKGEVVIVDTEAGVEHLGRGVEKGGDLAFMIVDPSYESVRLSVKVGEMMQEAAKPLYFIINKADDGASQFLSSQLDPELIVATFPNHKDVGAAGLKGEVIPHDVPGSKDLVRFIMGWKTS